MKDLIIIFFLVVGFFILGNSFPNSDGDSLGGDR